MLHDDSEEEEQFGEAADDGFGDDAEAVELFQEGEVEFVVGVAAFAFEE